jgi:hypothetical protein
VATLKASKWHFFSYMFYRGAAFIFVMVLVRLIDLDMLVKYFIYAPLLLGWIIFELLYTRPDDQLYIKSFETNVSKDLLIKRVSEMLKMNYTIPFTIRTNYVKQRRDHCCHTYS